MPPRVPGRAGLGDQLFGLLVHAHHRVARIVRQLVEVKELLQPRDDLAVLSRRNTLHGLPPRF